MNSRQNDLNAAEFLLMDKFKITVHKHRCCPFCNGTVYREKRKGFLRLMILFAMRPYRCESCDRLHYGFSF